MGRRGVCAAAASAGPQVDPPPPPFTPKYYGLATKQIDGKKTAFFLDGEDIILATEGMTVKKRFKLVRIAPTRWWCRTWTRRKSRRCNFRRMPVPAPVAGSREGERGFAMMLVFLMASMIAITLYLEIPRIAMQTQRDKEQVLIDRGEQYKRAIQLFVKKAGRYPGDIKELESFQNQRFLRQTLSRPDDRQRRVAPDPHSERHPDGFEDQQADGARAAEGWRRSTAGQFVGEQLAMGSTPNRAGGGAQNARDRRRAERRRRRHHAGRRHPGLGCARRRLPSGRRIRAVPPCPGSLTPERAIRSLSGTTNYPQAMFGQPGHPAGIPMPGRPGSRECRPAGRRECRCRGWPAGAPGYHTATGGNWQFVRGRRWFVCRRQRLVCRRRCDHWIAAGQPRPTRVAAGQRSSRARRSYPGSPGRR